MLFALKATGHGQHDEEHAENQPGRYAQLGGIGAAAEVAAGQLFLFIDLALGALLHQFQPLSTAEFGINYAAVFQIGQQPGLRQGDAHRAVQALA